MSGPLVLTLPMPAPVTNRRTGNGWRTVYAEKLRYAKACDELQRAGLIPPPPRAPFARATIASVMHLGHAMDDDNAMVRHKVSIDWLKTRGYIADDRKKCLQWAGLPEQIVKRNGNYRLVLTLTPVELSTIAYKKPARI